MPVSFEYNKKRKSNQGKTVRFDENQVFLEAAVFQVKTVRFDKNLIFLEAKTTVQRNVTFSDLIEYI